MAGEGVVDGTEGRLVYRGYEINELAGKATYEEVCFLLWKGHLANRAELDALRVEVGAQCALPGQVRPFPNAGEGSFHHL